MDNKNDNNANMNNDNSQQGYDYSQQQNYDYSQQQGYDYSQYDQQQYYDYSQQQNYDYSQQESYDYSQQGYDYLQQQNYDYSQQSYDQSQQQSYDYNQQSYNQSQQQSYDYNQQSYDQSQQQSYDYNQQRGYDYSQYNQQQYYDYSQQSYDYSQQTQPEAQPTSPSEPQSVTQPEPQSAPQPEAAPVTPAVTPAQEVKSQPVQELKVQPVQESKPKQNTKAAKPKKQKKERTPGKQFLRSMLISFGITFGVIVLGDVILVATIKGLDAKRDREREEAKATSTEITAEDWTDESTEDTTEDGGGKEQKTTEAKVYDDPELTAEGTTFSPVSKTIGDYDPDYQLYKYDITLVGAEYFKTPDGYEAVRIYYDFHNGSDRITYPEDSISAFALHGGIELEPYYGNNEDDPSEDPRDEAIIVEMTKSKNQYTIQSTKFVLPGATVRCAAEFYCEWRYKDPITFAVNHSGLETALWMNMDLDDPYYQSLPDTYSFFADLNPEDFPCKPESDEYLMKDSAPTWADSLPDTATVAQSYDMTIKDATVTEVDGEKHISISVDYTNLTGTPTSFYDAAVIGADLTFDWPRLLVMQDGVELIRAFSDSSLEAMKQEVARNETVTIKLEYTLRTDDPVEVVFIEMEINGKQETKAGKSFKVE